MKPMRALFLVLCLSSCLLAQDLSISTYLPHAGDYDPEIPKPAEILGFEVGSWHPRPDQLAAYAEKLAAASNRVQFRIYGRTHEQRPQVLLTISSPENLANLDQLESSRRALFDPRSPQPDLENMPLVAFMGYSVHGNESSGASAALLLAYHLAASQDPLVLKQLNDAIIFIDPCLNPDGLARFAHWVNSNRGKRINDDPRHREHHEPWPSGRTNHYWFDLNRDWLLARQPESRSRLALVEAWRPNLLTDFHEMGTNSTYFFQPGVRSRMNPLIPDRNFELTAQIAEANARALDRLGSLYYSQETFDDFYFGKGSTYPDALGGIGILFEQASSRGHAQTNKYGRIDFPFTIRNQLSCSLASLEAALSRRRELLSYQREFFRSALDLAEEDPTRAFVFQAPEGRQRARALVELLLMHGIEVFRLGAAIPDGEQTFSPDSAYIVPSDQSQYRLVKTLFERRTEFRDPVFYDVSAWNLLHSFDLPYLELSSAQMKGEYLGAAIKRVEAPEGQLVRLKAETPPYAFLISWDADLAAQALVHLQDAGLRVLATSEPLLTEVEGHTRSFPRGSLVIPCGIQDAEANKLRTLMESIARLTGQDIFELETGLTQEGIDLGSPSLRALERPSILVLVGKGTSAYEAGHIWHQLDLVMGMQVTLLDAGDVSASVLADYSHLLAVSGAERELAHIREDLATWIRAGGTLVSQCTAALWVGTELLALKAPARAAGDEPQEAKSYAERDKYRAENRVSGAIFAANLDLTHPLCWGLTRGQISLWHSGSTAMPMPKNRLDAPLVYRNEPAPLISGFAGARIQKRLAGTCAVAVERLGRGRVVRFADNMNFRAIWPGTSRLFVNAIFMAPLVESTAPEEEDNSAQEDESH